MEQDNGPPVNVISSCILNRPPNGIFCVFSLAHLSSTHSEVPTRESQVILTSQASTPYFCKSEGIRAIRSDVQRLRISACSRKGGSRLYSAGAGG